MKFDRLVKLLQELNELEEKRQRKEKLKNILIAVASIRQREEEATNVFEKLLKEAQDNKYTLKNSEKAKEILMRMRSK